MHISTSKMITFKITNFANESIVSYPLVLLRGYFDPQVFQQTVPSFTCSLNDDVEEAPLCVRENKFKALVRLTEGRNTIKFKLKESSLDELALLHLIYSPSKSNQVVRLIYLLAKDHDGSFQCSTNDDHDNPKPILASQSAGLKRFQLAAELIQCATAEFLWNQYQTAQRKTFTIATSAPYIHRLKFTKQEAFQMADGDLWSAVRKDLQENLIFPLQEEVVINLAVMSFSNWDQNEKKVRGHTALGGGDLALFGGASMFSWPEHWTEVHACFLNERPIEEFLFDDAHRKRYWAAASTTIGALLHELGHCLSLPHPRKFALEKGGGIMARGFDQFNRLFMLTENSNGFAEDQEPFFDRGSSIRLVFHKHCNPIQDQIVHDSLLLQPQSTPAPIPASDSNHKHNPHLTSASIWQGSSPCCGDNVGLLEQLGPVFSRKENRVLITSNSGIRHIAYLVNDENTCHEEFLYPEDLVSARILPEDNIIAQKVEGGQNDVIKISVINDAGEIGTKDLRDIQ